MEMVAAASSCVLCDRESFDVLRVFPGDLVFCESCPRRVGDFIFTGDSRSLDRIWKASVTSRRPAIEPADAVTHADLALAYLEMGLLQEALMEAAGVLSAGIVTTAALDALRVVFSERLAQRNAITQLRKLIFPNWSRRHQHHAHDRGHPRQTYISRSGYQPDAAHDERSVLRNSGVGQEPELVRIADRRE